MEHIATLGGHNMSMVQLAAELKQVRDMRLQLVEMLRKETVPSDSCATDWKSIDLSMNELLVGLSDSYTKQMTILVEHVEKSQLSKADTEELMLCNRLMVVLFGILFNHFKLVIERGRPNEAHLHFDRLIAELDKSDAASIRKMARDVASEILDKLEKGDLK